MVKAPRKICKHPSCGELTYNIYCEKHENKKKEVAKADRIKYDKERGTANQRGYNYRWGKYSQQYRKENPLCVMCEKEGKLTLAQCVDHIKPVSGPDDELFWKASNHQSLCNACHNIKSEAEGNRFHNKERFL